MIYDVAIVGAGVLGLAHAYQCARRGLKVIVLERHARAQGASVRNFGMLWPIGQPFGEMYDMAQRSREHWLTVLQASGIWHDRCGSLHLAYREDELQVLCEYAAESQQNQVPVQILTASEIVQRYPNVNPAGLLGGLSSATETTVDPRQVIGKLPEWLQREYGVQFQFDATVTNVDEVTIRTTQGSLHANRVIICTGVDFRDLAPAEFTNSGMIPCKLQMMRTKSYPPLGTMMAAGLTLKHYKSFQNCPTLPALTKRLDAELPEYNRYGIHVLVSQTESGQITIGDSHEYGDAIEPFDKAIIDGLILDYLDRFLMLPDLAITERWHGIYIKHPTKPYVTAKPRPNMLAVTGVGGAGMTLSFGLAEKNIHEFLGE